MYVLYKGRVDFVMNIVIGGCGKIGTNILESLINEGHNVVCIDPNHKVIEELTNIYDVMGVCGNASDCETLEEANINNTELFVAVTGSDELNMLSCFIAKKMGAKHTIARIRNPEYNDKSLDFMRKQLGLSMSINPDLLVARELFNILQLPSAIKVETFSRRNLEMIEFSIKPDSKLHNLKLSEFKAKYKVNLLIGIVQRGNEVYIPNGDFILQEGDHLAITTSHSEIEKLLKELGALKKKAKNIMILGGSRTSYYLAKLLCNIGVYPKIIEKDFARCQELCEELPKATIIHGDGTTQELLLEEGLQDMDAFVALTGMDEENILLSIFAETKNVPTVISKINRAEFIHMAQNLGLDCIVSPKDCISGVMLRYARALKNSMGSNVETLYKLMDGKAEALEFNVKAESPLINIPLKDLEIKKNILIAGIIRGRKTIIPGGDDVILPDDKVLILATEHKLNDLKDVLL